MTLADLRHVLTRRPDADPTPLEPELDLAALATPLEVDALRALLAGYLLDRDGGPISDAPADVDRWIDGSPMAVRLAPGGGRPRSDALAALVAAPVLIGPAGLAAAAWSGRAGPRADDALGAAVTLLSDEHAAATVDRLAREALPDEELVHLALLQAGRALAWSAARLAAAPVAAALVERLLALLVPAAPEPLGLGVVAALGPVAATATPLGARVRERAQAILDEEMAIVEPPRLGGSFLAEFETLRRGHQDVEWFRTLPRRRLAARAAALLGRGAAHGDVGALHAAVTRWPGSDPLAAAFVEGVAASGDPAAVAALTDALLAGDDDAVALGLSLASERPVDACAAALCRLLAGRDPGRRLLAVAAVAQLTADVAVPALADALDDEDAEVCATAAVALREHGRTDLLDARRLSPGSPRRFHAAVVRAAIPDLDHAVLTTLVAEIGEQIDAADELGQSDDEGAGEAATQLIDAITASPILESLGAALRGSTLGIQRTIQLLREVPGTLPVVALAIGCEPPAVALPATLHAPLAAAMAAVTAEAPALETLALGTLALLGRGDAALADRVIAALRADGGRAGELFGALAALRVRSTAAADALLPHVRQIRDLAARGAAAAVAGTVAPPEHPIWAHVRELLGLGTVLGDAAHAALVERARAAAVAP